MLDLFNIAKPQGCDIQTFYRMDNTWLKPRGVSHVYMMLIGGGGNGNGTTGGGSGAVTVWYGSAQHVPDDVYVSVSTGNASNTVVSYQGSQGANNLNTLLTASAASGATGGVAMTANIFAASGFFQSVAGQAGSSAGITASTTTFLSGGASGSGNIATANYGYVINPSAGIGSFNGIFQTQPIIVGAGGIGIGTGGIGCGGGLTSGSKGGPGMVLIASW